MSQTAPVERYYEAIDAMDSEALTAVLAPEFCHDRPDQTIDGRERFVEFMATERPRTDTEHVVETLFLPAEGESGTESTDVAVHGRLLADGGEELFAFVDLFTVADGQIQALETFTN